MQRASLDSETEKGDCFIPSSPNILSQELRVTKQSEFVGLVLIFVCLNAEEI